MTIAFAPGRRKAMALAIGALAGCAAPPPACLPAAPGAGAWVVSHGWHIEIALRRDALAGPLARLAAAFPGADALAFGFGKRGFMLAGAGAVEQWLLGPLPGPGVIQVTGLSGPPPRAYPGRAVALPLTPDGMVRLAGFLAASFARDGTGRLVPARPEPLLGSVYYEAARGYSLLYTCNRWAAEGLREAGLPVRPDGAILAGAVLAQLGPPACTAAAA